MFLKSKNISFSTQICDSFGIEFMALRFWAGIWLVIVIAIVVCFEGSFLVSYFTRFTQEIFASLISLIFIIEVFIKLSKVSTLFEFMKQYSTLGVQICFSGKYNLVLFVPLFLKSSNFMGSN